MANALTIHRGEVFHEWNACSAITEAMRYMDTGSTEAFERSSDLLRLILSVLSSKTGPWRNFVTALAVIVMLIGFLHGSL